MNYIKKAIYGPDPQEQKQKCNSLIRKNQRELDKMLSNLSVAENKTKTMIKSAARRNDVVSARMLAKEIYNCKKQRERLYTSKSQLNSVMLQVNEAFALRKIEGTMKTSTGVMKEVNTLVRMPELMGTMNQLSQELMRAGIIEEMVGDTMDMIGENEFEDEEIDEQVDAILSEVTGGKLGIAGRIPQNLPAAPSKATPVEEEEEEEEEEANTAMLDDMRQRLKALQS
ncbi:vacuolar protein-sorting-associated protein 24 [Trichomonascus vanleenenianus]|uniref:ESCRT-III subunit protein VPS24 n=1 Tax=Trichomonascus vanleenenianus TaxID=2268995 RepID=UPI003ECAA74B